MSTSSINSTINVNKTENLEIIKSSKASGSCSQEQSASTLSITECFVPPVNEQKIFSLGLTLKDYDFIGNKGNTGSIGIRAETENKLVNAGPVSVSSVYAFGLNGGNGVNIDTGLGGKISIGCEYASIYGSLMGTLNVGILGNEQTSGIGFRTAAGAEVNGVSVEGMPYSVYLEAFKENSFNYDSNGFQYGLRVRI